MNKIQLIALVAVIGVFPCCKVLQNPKTYDKGVVINGVTWATRNVDKPDTFAENPEDAGMFYQWNRKIGWNATDEEVENWKTSVPQGVPWKKAKDPCPKGWRVPTYYEIKKTLLDKENVTNEWVRLNDVNGRKFTDKATGNTIFFPASGYRSYSNGRLGVVGANGMYWIYLEGEKFTTCNLDCNRRAVNIGHGTHKANGLSVRCVAE